MKKFLLSLLAIICATTFAFATEKRTGKCGDDVTWTLTWDDSWYKTLTLTGSGDIYDYKPLQSPVDGYPQIRYVNMSNGITRIGDNFLSRSTSDVDFTTVNWSTSLKSIGKNAFEGAGFSETNIILPSQLERIEDEAFNRSNIYGVTLPASLSYIAPTAFRNCPLLTTITVHKDNTVYASQDGVLFSKDMKELILLPIHNHPTNDIYAIPKGVTVIADYGIHTNDFIQEIEIPMSVVQIGAYGLSSPNFEKISCLRRVPPTAQTNTFSATKENIPVYIPTGTLAAYKAATGWSQFTNFIETDFPNDCKKPTNFALVGEASFSSATFSFTPGAEGQTGWGLRYKKSSDSEYITSTNRIPNTGATSYNISLAGLEPETEYNVVIYSICGASLDDQGDVSYDSDPITFTTGKTPAPQNTPTVENDWVYYGTNTFGMSGEVAGDTYWGMMIPTNVAVSKYLDTVALYASSLDEMEISIYTGGNTPDKATKVWSQNVVPTELNTFNYFALVEPIEYVKSKNLWIFFRNTNVYNIPIAYSVGANTPNARWIGIASGDNVTWMDMKDFAPEYSYITWLIDAHFTAKPVYHPYAKDIVAKKVNNNSVTLGWTGRADKFEVRYRKVANPEEEWNLKINITSKSTTISKLEAEKDYEFQVRAKLGDDYSDWSEVLNVFTEDKVAIDQVLEEKAPGTKFMKDGQLFILHDGKIYNASGFRVQ